MTPLAGLVAGAFLSGLVGSAHCVGMCGPFAVACGTSRRESIGWHLGRGLTYAGLGGLAGAFGAALPGPRWLPTVVSLVLVVWFAGVLAGVLPEPRFRPPGLTQLARPGARGPRFGPRVLFGMATGLLPCGLVYAALGLALATLGPLSGALVMTAFWAGTVPALAALVLLSQRLGLRTLRGRRVLALVVLVTGLLSVAMRGGMLGDRGLHDGHGGMHGADSPAAHVSGGG